MNQDTKQIDSVTNGAVCKGYIKTKVGVLPRDWGVVKLSDVFDHVSKKNADNSISNVLTNSATKGIVKQ